MSITVKFQKALEYARDVFPSLANASFQDVFLAALGGIALWLILRGGNAIAGEYAKRFWFRYVHRDAAKSKDAKIDRLAAELVLAQAEIRLLHRELNLLRTMPTPTTLLLT